MIIVGEKKIWLKCAGENKYLIKSTISEKTSAENSAEMLKNYSV